MCGVGRKTLLTDDVVPLVSEMTVMCGVGRKTLLTDDVVPLVSEMTCYVWSGT